MKSLTIPTLLIVLLSACSNKPYNSQSDAMTPAAAPVAAPAPIAEMTYQAAAAPAKQEMFKRKLQAEEKASPAMHDMASYSMPPQANENYASLPENSWVDSKNQHISTFSIDVDTAAYANMRRFINNGQLPPVEAVRIEEMVNYFDYNYPAPTDANTPFKVSSEMGPTPWSSNSMLLQIGIKGFDPHQGQQLPRNLVFLLDVSGSMNEPNKLPLVKQSLRLLVNQLGAKDSVAIVVYAGASGVVLPPTPGNQRDTILNAIERLTPGGSTNGAEGIQRAYELAQQHFIKQGVNRVILATDGDFNVGLSNTDDLIQLIKQKKRSGVGLTVLGVGMGNYNDHMLEQISDSGDGNAAYIDTLQEAKKVLVNDINATLQTIARDTKIQIEFNPDVVKSYRLIGYENRMLKQEDFSNDRVDAGDIGAGHTVTALYEIHLTQPTRYQQNKPSNSDELGLLKIRYKRPQQEQSIELSHLLHKSDIKNKLEATSNNYRFAAAVAAFGQILRHSKQTGDYTLGEVMQLANGSLGDDKFGYRNEFVRLVDSAKSMGRTPTPEVLTNNTSAAYR